MEPIRDDHRELVDAAVEAIASMTPSKVLPANRLVGEELARRSLSRHKTRHQVVRLIASQYGINGGPMDAAASPQWVEDDLAREITRTSTRLQRYRPETIPDVLGDLASDYFDQYMEDQAGLSRWLLFAAIATVPGELDTDDDVDREAFREAIAEWLDVHVDRYADAYGALLGELGRRDRVGDGYRTLAHALGMLAEGAILRASVDPKIGHAEASRTFRQAALGLVAVFSAQTSDERTVDDLFGEILAPTDEA